MPQTHDASTGFRDLKPSPEFVVPFAYHWILIALVVGILLFIFWRIWTLKKQAPTEKAILPLERALSSIRELEVHVRGGNVRGRDFGHQLSTVLRAYLESVLGLPAGEMTNTELARSLLAAIKKRLSTQTDQRIQEFCDQSLHILSACERMTFAGDENLSKTASVKSLELLSQTSALVVQFDGALLRELQPTKQVSSDAM